MERQIITCQLTHSQLKEELSFFVAYFSDRGMDICKVLFGAAWGNRYYTGGIWHGEEIRLSNLISKVKEVEASGIGALGQDDLWIEPAGLKFRYCNDSDIHVYFVEASGDIEFYYTRWKMLGYHPAEWLHTDENSHGKSIRSD